MATELAKAYVQIVPSADGIKGSIAKIIDPEAESAGKSGGSKLMGGLKSVLGGAGAIAGAAVTAAAAGVAAITKAAVDNYANYEQLVGGVETLFKDSSDQVMQYANDAYKTAGLSANDYMETVTGFSASLLQGLGGDTKQAADVANRAVIDMADNANKMGTSIESIQNAYQGFAKQNYTMLDNLKLGYGGTKSEMERLIQDAAQMTDIQKELGISVDANSMSFDNIINAISVMQSSLGIAGTTALEAGETISGSVGSVKAAWDNLVTGIADDNADFDTLIDNFVNSASTMFSNLMPRIQTALTGVANLISKLAPVIVEQIPVLASSILPQLLASISSVASSIAAVLPELISTLALTIVDNLPMLINSGIEIMLALVLGISQSLPELIPAIVDALLTIVDTLISNIDLLIDAAIQLTMGLAEGLIQALPILIEKIPEIVLKLADALITNAPLLLQASFELIMILVKGIVTYTPQLIAQIPVLMEQLKTKFIELCVRLVEIGSKIVSTIKQAVAEKWSVVTSSVSGWMDNLKAKFKEKIDNFISIGSDIVGGIKNGISQAWESVTSWFSDKVNSLVQTAKDALKIGSPSKVFAKEVGKWIPYGMAKGVNDNLGVVKEAISNMTDYAVESAAVSSIYDASAKSSSFNYSGSLNGNVGNGYNQTVNIYSPTALSPSEIARQTRNSTRNMVLALRGV